MKDLITSFVALPAVNRRRVLLDLCESALKVWEEQFAEGSHTSYTESVAGTMQVLDVLLPREALIVSRENALDTDIAQRYQEPIVALQDEDLELPDSAQFAYYSIYNVFRLFVLHKSIDEKLIISQALSALPENERRQAFSNALA